MDKDEMRQLLTYLKYQMADQDKAIAAGDKYINKNWRRTAKAKIKYLKQAIKEVA